MYIDRILHEEVRSLLMREFALVPGRPASDVGFAVGGPSALSELERKKLVFEYQGTGMYRVDCLAPVDCDGVVLFRYWERAVTPEISTMDPMLDAVRRVYDRFGPIRCTTDAGFLRTADDTERDIQGRP